CRSRSETPIRIAPVSRSGSWTDPFCRAAPAAARHCHGTAVSGLAPGHRLEGGRAPLVLYEGTSAVAQRGVPSCRERAGSLGPVSLAGGRARPASAPGPPASAGMAGGPPWFYTRQGIGANTPGELRRLLWRRSN